MNWIIKIMKEDYGTRNWNKMSTQDQMRVVAEFLNNYFNAVKYLKKCQP